MFTCASYSVQRVIFVNNIIALINAINNYFHININSTDFDLFIYSIAHGFHSHLPTADYEVLYTVNTNIFNIVSKYLSTTYRFTNSW